MNTMTLVALTLCSFAPTALADNRTETPKEIASLQRLVGEWSTRTGTALVAGKPAKLDIKVTCATTTNKLGVLCQSRIAIEGLGTIEGTDLFGYDAASKSYHWFCVNGLGDVHDHVAKVGPKDKGFTWVYEGPGKDGKPTKEVITMNLDNAGSKMDFRNEITIGGQPAFKLTAAMLKK